MSGKKITELGSKSGLISNHKTVVADTNGIAFQTDYLGATTGVTISTNTLTFERNDGNSYNVDLSTVIPTSLLDLGISGGTQGQYLSTDGSFFFFENIKGNNYILINTTSTTQNGTNPATNGQRIFDAYNFAKTYKPPTTQSNPINWNKSDTNRFVILIPPGFYQFSSALTIDTDFIDLVGIGSDINQIKTSPTSTLYNSPVNQNNVYIFSSSFISIISVTSSNNRIIGISSNRGISIGNNLTDLVVKNCDLGGQSFNAANVSGYFENVIVRSSGSFGSQGSGEIASGTFINCSVLQGIGFGSGFGQAGATGYFENCKAGDDSFASGGNSPIICSGTFKNCDAGNNSFGSFVFGSRDITVSGYFENCKAGNNSFGYATNLTSSGTFKNCEAGDNSFGVFTSTGDITGIFKNCEAGDNSFGSGLNISGSSISGATFELCSGGEKSFGFEGIIQSGTTFEMCTGGDKSFVGNDTDLVGSIFGKILRCRKTTGTFKTPDVGGNVVLGIDGSYAVVNL
jgi:hypothetical protein